MNLNQNKRPRHRTLNTSADSLGASAALHVVVPDQVHGSEIFLYTLKPYLRREDPGFVCPRLRQELVNFIEGLTSLLLYVADLPSSAYYEYDSDRDSKCI